MSTSEKRVVVTGIGLITSNGTGRAEVWESILAGRSGAAPITLFDTTEFVTKFACEVKGCLLYTSPSPRD